MHWLYYKIQEGILTTISFSLHQMLRGPQRGKIPTPPLLCWTICFWVHPVQNQGSLAWPLLLQMFLSCQEEAAFRGHRAGWIYVQPTKAPPSMLEIQWRASPFSNHSKTHLMLYLSVELTDPSLDVFTWLYLYGLPPFPWEERCQLKRLWTICLITCRIILKFCNPFKIGKGELMR